MSAPLDSVRGADAAERAKASRPAGLAAGSFAATSHRRPPLGGLARRRRSCPAPTLTHSILDRFLGSNRQARELAQRASDCDVNRIRFRNPFIPVIWFTVGTGLEMIAKHEQRHLLQAERVRAALTT